MESTVKDKIEEFLEKEKLKLDSIKNADINGYRLLSSINEEVQNIRKKASLIKDPNEMINFVLSKINSMESVFSNINHEVNSSRKQQKAKINGINDCLKIISKEEEFLERQKELEIAEEQKLTELAKEIESGRDPEKERRKPRTRPEKIKDVRNAKSMLEKSKNIT